MKSRGIIAGWIEPESTREAPRTRVTINVELQPMHYRTGQTVDHLPVLPIITRLSISGTETEGRREVSGGQITEALRRVNHPNELRLDECAELADLWDRWHLNDMRAACIHQAAEAKALYVELPGYSNEAVRWERLRELPCPEGYKYGDAWLVEYLPPEVEQRIRQLTGLVEVPA